jgi:acyl-coenzyme A thioesterase PaaI-like protein
MHARSGPFWDGIQGRAPMPPAAATLGFEFVDADVEAGTIELAFAATKAFTNPAGNVLGGFVAAMLFDTVGPALLATLEPDQFQSTLQLNVSFLRATASPTPASMINWPPRGSSSRPRTARHWPRPRSGAT